MVCEGVSGALSCGQLSLMAHLLLDVLNNDHPL